MTKHIIIDTEREGCDPNQIDRTLTLEELIGVLEEMANAYGEETEVYLGFDNRYTYGGIWFDSIDVIYTDSEGELAA